MTKKRPNSAPPTHERAYSHERAHSDAHPWYALDHAALIYPPILSDRVSAYYRIQATLDEPVDTELLQTALDTVRPRFPYFQTELRKGFFWFFFERNDQPQRIAQDSKFPMQKLSTKRRGVYLYRVRTHENRVALEMCHILTDGYGALIFFRTLLAEYYRLQGIPTPYGDGVLDPAGAPEDYEWEDAFSRYATPGAPKPTRGKSAWHLPGMALPIHTMRVTTGELSLSAALAKAKTHGATLTVYLSSVYLAALQDVQDADPQCADRRKRKKLRLQVPANLRNFFPSRTLRNFSLYALPDLDTRLGHYEFGEIVTRVKAMMTLAFDPKELRRTITRNVTTTKNPFIRIIPLAIKNPMMRAVYKTHGENLYTSLSTNVGQAKLPESFADRVKRIDVILPSTPGLKTVAGILSHRDSLSVSFGSVIERNDLERAFFTRLVKDGLRVKVESNLPLGHGKEHTNAVL
ncbi:MAG: hypothetical protein CVV47_13240 [Spirochaetae bacterium HGW-Spirochaetae-3]|jgi:NRPS condensation-like uncharacterized protein|nr:MAG: hypothetical protein CVV47_13240 [Spirochaetae bacterium HGW-Spirochaetae-3]